VQYKLLAFFVAGFIGGVAGAFWISNLAAISPEHFPWFWSLWLVGVILIGGVGSIHGTIFGSIFMVVVMELLQMAHHAPGPCLPQAADGLSFYQGGRLRPGHLRLHDLRAQRAGLSLVADQKLFQPLAVFLLGRKNRRVA
jgi:MFS family permease